MKLILVSVLIVINFGFSNSISVNMGLPSPSKGLIGINFQPVNSSFEYSVFYGNLDLVNYDAGLGLSYYLNEDSGLFIAQGYHWMFGGNVNMPHTLGVYTGIGYKYLVSGGLSFYSDVGVPIFVNENGTYSNFTGFDYDTENTSFLIGLGLNYNF